MPTVDLKHLFATGLAVAFLGGCSSGGGAVGGNAAHGQAIAKARCAACHGPEGNNTTADTYPRLAGQNADYLYRQLVDYRDGARTSTVMVPVVKSLSDQDLKDAAAFFAGQVRGSDPPGPQAMMAEGRRLSRSGSLGVPACAACHAPGAQGRGHMRGMMGRGHMRGMMGMRSAGAPILYGQHAAYVVAQLHAFADGSRPSLVMSPIAKIMTARQQQAVADYLAAHP